MGRMQEPRERLSSSSPGAAAAKAQYSAIVLGATGNVGGRIVQLLIKNPLCKKQPQPGYGQVNRGNPGIAMAPTQSAQPLVISQVGVMGLFVVLGIFAVKRFHAEPVGIAAVLG